MKYITGVIVAILLLSPCCVDAAYKVKGDMNIDICSVGSDYTANAIAIEQKKQEMLAVADSVGHFWFSDDTEFQSQDPHAYWQSEPNDADGTVGSDCR